MENSNNYKAHNQRILQEVAGEKHQQWCRDRDRRALKRAKRDAMPPLGFKSNNFQVVRLLK